MEETQQLVNTIIDGIQEKKGRDIVVVNLQHIITAPCAYLYMWLTPASGCRMRLIRIIRTQACSRETCSYCRSGQFRMGGYGLRNSHGTYILARSTRTL